MNEMLETTCPSCQAQFEVPTDLAGKQGRCPGCQMVFAIGGGEVPVEASQQYQQVLPEQTATYRSPVGHDGNMFDWYRVVLSKYADFSGRSRRAEYWYFVLVNLIINIGLAIGDVMFGLVIAPNLGVLGLVYGLAVFIPSIAVLCRRLHDTGRSGWWWLIALIPLVGGIILIVFLAEDSDPGDSNNYGPNPKTMSVASSQAAGQ